MIEQIETIAVVDAGYTATGNGERLTAAGVTATLADATAEEARPSRDRALSDVAHGFGADVPPAATVEAVKANLSSAPTIEHAAERADFVEEVVPETVSTSSRLPFRD